MKIAIPSIVKNSTISSEVAECPIAAKSILIFDTQTEKCEVIPVEHTSEEICTNVAALVELGVNAFVSGVCCRDHFQKFREHGITVYKCTSCRIKDMIQNFVLGGAFIRTYGDEMDHSHESDS
jgi:predicted Fe-Mo cluster-binding NifX family protein